MLNKERIEEAEKNIRQYTEDNLLFKYETFRNDVLDSKRFIYHL